MVVDGHQGFVLEDRSKARCYFGRAFDVLEEGRISTGKVPGRATVVRRAEQQERAREVRIAGDFLTTLEGLTRQVSIALRVEGYGRVAASLPVLARRGSKGRLARADPPVAAREAIPHRRIVPTLAAIAAVGHAARAVAATVVVVTGDDMLRVVWIDSDRRFVLRLGTALQIAVGKVQAILIDLDVAANVRLALIATGKV